MDFSEAISRGGPAYIVGEPRPGQVMGEYRIEKLIGRGGMGAVFLAAHPFSGQKIALKVLRKTYSDVPKFRGRFEREIEALKTLDHPNIVKILGRGEANGVHYFMMNLVRGVSLRDVMKAGRLNLRERLQVVREVSQALQHAHDHNVIHRDLKPQNVLIDDGLHAQVVDFGIARLTRNNLLTLTRTGQIIGTSRYMAPEQQRDTKRVDGRADVYSIGVMAYELLGGRLPFGSFAPLSRLAPQLPPAVDAVIEKALEARPEDRYAGPGKFWADFERALKGPSAATRRRLTAAGAVVGGVVALALLGAGVAALLRGVAAPHAAGRQAPAEAPAPPAGR
jgi:serine/threonine-protein kinase